MAHDFKIERDGNHWCVTWIKDGKLVRTDKTWRNLSEARRAMIFFIRHERMHEIYLND